MSDQTLDPRFERLVRESLKAEAASLPVTVRPDQILDRARARSGSGAAVWLGWLGLGRSRAGGPRRTLALGASAAVLVLVVSALGWGLIANQPAPSDAPSPEPGTETPGPTQPSSRLGIFEPIAGWIVFGNGQGIWGFDPAAPSAGSRIKLAAGTGTPLAWSGDGTRLLVQRDSALFILYADGSETRLVDASVFIHGAAISPDGTRVVYASGGALHSVDVGDGLNHVLRNEPRNGRFEAPTFSPDGTQIAYIDGDGDHGHTVWVMDADGSEARQILVPPDCGCHVHGLAWSPAGDRIALALDTVGTYTFGPDGAGLKLDPDEFDPERRGSPYWSPDGAQLERSGPWHPGLR